MSVTTGNGASQWSPRTTQGESPKPAKMLAGFLVLMIVLVICTASAFAQNVTTFNGITKATSLAYGYNNVPALTVGLGSNTTGSYTVTLNFGQVSSPAGIVFNPISVSAPITIGVGTSLETVTPTAVSCTTPLVYQTCTFTATFTYAHNTGDTVRSGTYGLQEALNYASATGGGLAGIDSAWTQLGGTTTNITAAAEMPNTAIMDTRTLNPTFWNIQPTASTAIAVPTTLTSTTFATQTTPAGSYTTGNYIACVSYVDFMGNEGACSATSGNIAGSASGSWLVTAPVASAGAVGYTIYISLVSGAYTAMYHVPLTSAICTLTTVETITPACAVANTTYGQSAANATVTALTVNTAQLAMNSAVIGTTTVVHGNAIAKTTYGYVPGTSLAASGIQGVYFPATGAAATSTNLDTVASLAIPANFMQIGRKLRVCGNATMSGASTATILGVDLIWDADGQNTAGAPVIISQNQLTPGSALSASVLQYHFCQTIVATVTGTTVTGGTALAGDGFLSYSQTSAGTVGYGGPVTTVGTTGSLNFISPARLHIAFVHTTGTDGAATILQNATVEVL